MISPRNPASMYYRPSVLLVEKAILDRLCGWLLMSLPTVFYKLMYGMSLISTLPFVDHWLNNHIL